MVRITLVVPVSPRHVGTGLAGRARNWERFLSRLGEVRTIVVPVAGPHHPDEATLLPGPDSDDTLPRLARGLTRAHGRAHSHLAAGSDLVVALRSYLGDLALGMGEAPGVPVVVDLDDDDASYFAQRDDRAEAERFRGLVARLRNDAIALVSADGFDGTIPIPNAVEFPDSIDRPETPAHTAIMVANFAYEPNAEGARWLLSEVVPLVRRTIPDFLLTLVGPGGPRLDPTATGPVDDLAPLYGGAAVALAPIFHGAGTRTKIIEAWAHRVPVVSTSTGAAGLSAVDGETILVADSPEDFAARVVSVLADPPFADRLADSGWRHGRERFSAPVVAEMVGALVKRIADTRHWVFSASPDAEITETDDGLVIFEPRTDTVHNLNRTAAVVFMLADGTRDRTAICAEVTELFGLDQPPTREIDDVIDTLLRTRLIRADVAG